MAHGFGIGISPAILGGGMPASVRANLPSLDLDFLFQRYGMNRQPKAFSDLITFTRPSAATRVNPLGLIESVAANVPCIDHSPVNLATGTGAQTLALAKDRTYAITAVGGTVAVAGAGVNVSQMGAAAGVIQTPAGSGTVDVTFTPGGGVTALHVREVLGLSVFEQKTNYLLNSEGNFSTGYPATQNGVTKTIVGSGNSLGFNYVDIRCQGTVSATYFDISLGYRDGGVPVGDVTSSFYYQLLSVSNGVPGYRALSMLDYATGWVSEQSISSDLSAIGVGQPGKFYSVSKGARADRGIIASSLSFGTALNQVVDFVVRVGASQIENGTSRGPYIPTYGSQVTRASDTAAETLSPWFNPSKGTVIFAGDVAAVSSGKWPGLFLFDDGAFANRIGAYVNPNGTVAFTRRISGASVEALSANSIVAGSRFKVACSWDATNLYISLNGGAVASFPHGGLPTVSRLLHGRLDDFLSGHEAVFKYLPKSTVGSALQALSA